MNRFFKRGTALERLLYEASPIFYLFLSIVALSQENVPGYGRGAAFLLFIAGLAILALRIEYRGYLRR